MLHASWKKRCASGGSSGSSARRAGGQNGSQCAGTAEQSQAKKCAAQPSDGLQKQAEHIHEHTKLNVDSTRHSQPEHLVPGHGDPTFHSFYKSNNIAMTG